jgi:hypothetical protein
MTYAGGGGMIFSSRRELLRNHENGEAVKACESKIDSLECSNQNDGAKLRWLLARLSKFRDSLK